MRGPRLLRSSFSDAEHGTGFRADRDSRTTVSGYRHLLRIEHAGSVDTLPTATLGHPGGGKRRRRHEHRRTLKSWMLRDGGEADGQRSSPGGEAPFPKCSPHDRGE